MADENGITDAQVDFSEERVAEPSSGIGNTLTVIGWLCFAIGLLSMTPALYSIEPTPVAANLTVSLAGVMLVGFGNALQYLARIEFNTRRR
jgi:hypothetical protein